MRKGIITLAALLAFQALLSGCVLVDRDHARHERYEEHEEHEEHEHRG